MKRITQLLTAATLAISSQTFAALPSASGTIAASLNLYTQYSISTTALQFGDHVVPTAGTQTIDITPGGEGSSTVTVTGADGAATLSLANAGAFHLIGQNSKDLLPATAFFTGNAATEEITLASGKAITSVGASTELLSTTKADSYTGNVTINVTKNI